MLFRVNARSRMVDLSPPAERAFLVAVDTGQDAGWTAEESLTELGNLSRTAGAEVVGAEWQNRRHVDPNWYVGKGKADELLGLALADVPVRVHVAAVLPLGANDFRAGRARQVAQLGQRFLGRPARILARVDGNEERTLGRRREIDHATSGVHTKQHTVRTQPF